MGFEVFMARFSQVHGNSSESHPQAAPPNPPLGRARTTACGPTWPRPSRTGSFMVCICDRFHPILMEPAQNVSENRNEFARGPLKPRGRISFPAPGSSFR